MQSSISRVRLRTGEILYTSFEVFLQQYLGALLPVPCAVLTTFKQSFDSPSHTYAGKG